jgi:UDP-2,3-diacylglucosamine hydrolase
VTAPESRPDDPIHAPGPAPVGIIAGRGLLPLAIVEGIRRGGREAVCVNVFNGDPRLAEVADAYYAVPLGELGGVIGGLRRHGVRDVVLAGTVDKLAVLATSNPDAAAMRVALRLLDRRDASLLSALISVLEEDGFNVMNQAMFCGDLVPDAGVLSRRPPSANEQRDIRLGLIMARGIAGLDVGQSVAIRRGVVVAVEAAEGTDAMIQRAGALVSGVVVVKVSRPRQDPRFDLPVVGPQTVEAIAASGGTALAIEAGRTILLERGRLVAAADAAGIAVVACDAPDPGPDPWPPVRPS